MRRGEVWWAEFPGLAGRRPAVLLSRNSAYAIRLSVTVAPVTTRVRGIPVEVPLGPDDGLPMESVANLDDITTLSKSRLLSRITNLSEEKLHAVETALRFALGLSF